MSPGQTSATDPDGSTSRVAAALPTRRVAVAQRASQDAARRTRRADTRNVLLILGVWAFLLYLVPYQHDFSTIDDYIYSGSVQDMLRTGAFHMPDLSQANLVGLTVWGVIWSRLFGYSMTTLTVSTLFMATVALILFYAIMRLVGCSPRVSLLGTALLLFDPIFFHLSYSFMTDVPFLSVMLGATYCYLRGIKHEGRLSGLTWVAAGGLLTGWAFLIRQFGILVPVAFAIYLVASGLLNRKWTRPRWWLHVVLLALIPAAVVVWHAAWSHDFPITSAAGGAAARSANFVLKEPWLRVFLLRTLTVLPLTAFCAWTALKIRRGHRWLLAVFAVGIIWGMYALDLPGETWLQQQEPQFIARLGPFTYIHPNEPYSFGLYGDIVRVTGFDFDEYQYNQAKVWTPEAWRAIFMFGVLLGIVLCAKIVSSLVDWVASTWREWRAWRQRTRGSGAGRDEARGTAVELRPVMAFYLLGAITVVVSLAFPGDLFDRYLLAYIPFLIVFVVRTSGEWGRAAWTYSLVALTLLATFTVLAKHDYMDHNNAIWQAATWMEQRTGQVRAGWNWTHLGHNDSESYLVDDVKADGFRMERDFPYTCRLCGFTTQHVLAQSRTDMPPLPPN